jgi:Helix-turn-helix domain
VSVEAITWALAQSVERSSTKFVLVAMANCAGPDMTCWPSVAYLCAATAQDRKTVIENIKRLRESGFIEPTDGRKGATGQVVVYSLKRPETGTVKEAQKRNSSENGTVPKFPSKSPVFPIKESRFSAETVPKTGHGTVREPSIEPSRKQIAASVHAPTPPAPFLGDENIEALNGRNVVALADKWELPMQWGLDSEALGWKPGDVLKESEKFRQYWTAGKGAGTRRSVKGWRQSWSNWLSNAEKYKR